MYMSILLQTVDTNQLQLWENWTRNDDSLRFAYVRGGPERTFLSFSNKFFTSVSFL